MHADVALECRVLHLEGNRTSTSYYTEGSLNKRDFKACPHSDTLPLTRLHFLIAPLPWEVAIFFQTTIEGRLERIGL